MKRRTFTLILTAMAGLPPTLTAGPLLNRILQKKLNVHKPNPMKTATDSLIVRRSSERGHADHGWLKSYHSFSFADYYDPAHMGFRSLRVINEDHIAPGGGFPTHPHRDMEIFSYVVKGALQHKDSLGNGRVLQPGQIQLMSAGKGVLHSEFNPSSEVTTHMLQIWIQPRQRGLVPSYTEWHPDPAREAEPKVLVISSEGRDGSATIQQDADVYRVRLPKGESITQEIRSGRGVWFQLIKGSVTLGGITLEPGDAVSSETAGDLTFTAGADAEALLFDLG
jgi:redox-sensitive bicupin YhaK (pirin superfamily)